MKNSIIIGAALLLGCSTTADHSGYYAAQQQIAAQPLFTCAKCEGVTVGNPYAMQQMKQATNPTNGWDFGKSLVQGILGLADKNGGYAAGVLLIDRVAGKLTGNTTTTTNTTTTSNATTSADVSEYVSQSSSNAYTADRGAQLAGGDAIRESQNPTSNTSTSTTSTTDGSYNPSTVSYPQNEKIGE